MSVYLNRRIFSNYFIIYLSNYISLQLIFRIFISGSIIP